MPYQTKLHCGLTIGKGCILQLLSRTLFGNSDHNFVHPLSLYKLLLMRQWVTSKMVRKWSPEVMDLLFMPLCYHAMEYSTTAFVFVFALSMCCMYICVCVNGHLLVKVQPTAICFVPKTVPHWLTEASIFLLNESACYIYLQTFITLSHLCCASRNRFSWIIASVWPLTPGLTLFLFPTSFVPWIFSYLVSFNCLYCSLHM